jgi:hypothetical protein
MVRLALVVCCVALVACGGKKSSKPDAGDASTDGDASMTADAPHDQADTASPAPDGGKAEVAPDVAPDVTPDGGSPDAVVDARSDASEVSGRRQLRAIAIASGRYHMCALLEDHQVKCWGDNGEGQLGQGDKKFRGAQLADMGDALPPVDLGTGRTAKVLAAGRYATCVILDTDDLKCWGHAQMAGLPGSGYYGDEPGEMGDALPIVDLGAGRKAKRVAVSYSDTCVERDDGKVRCWGLGGAPSEPQVDGEIQSLSGAGTHVMAILTGGSVFDLRGDPVGRLTLPRPVRSVSGAASAWCAVLDDSSLSCTSVPGTAPPANARVELVAMTEFGRDFSALLADGTVRTWRSASAFPWTKVPASDPMGGSTLALGQPAQDLVGGGFNHTCALLADGTVKCWAVAPSSKENAIGSGPNDGIDGTIWRAVNLGTHE